MKKTNANAKCRFEEDNKILINAFTKFGIAIKDTDGNFRLMKDVLRDIGEKYDSKRI